MNNQIYEDTNEINLDTRWIQEFELIDDNYKQFYNEVVDDIKICSIYVDKNNEIENIKQDTLELSRENLITKEEMIKIIKQNSITQKKRYTLLSLLKYNFDLSASNVVHYLKQKQQQPKPILDDTYLTLVKNIDDIPLNNTINMMQDLNTIFVLFYEKQQSSCNSTTKKVYLNNHTKTKKKQLKVS